MNKLILIFAVFTGIRAHADFVSWKMGPVHGILQARGNLVLEEAQTIMHCQYCRLTTCAGGPSKETALATQLTPRSSHQYQLSVEGGRHFSAYPLKNLSGCGYYLTLKGYDRESGAEVRGEVALAYSQRNDSNPIWNDDYLAAALTDRLTSKGLVLEIQIRGLAPPAIYPVEQN